MPKFTLYTSMSLAESEEHIRDHAPPDFKVLCARDYADPKDQKAALETADIVLGNPPAAWLRDTSRLRWIQLESVGIDAYRASAGEEWTRRIVVTNLKGFFGIPVAETLVAGVLSLQRGLAPLLQAQTGARWVRDEVRPRLDVIHGRSAIVLGAGSIGRHVRQILTGLGVTTRLYARTATDADLRTPAELDAEMPRADLVFGCLPDTPDTRGLLDRKRINSLPAQAIIANGGRGSLIDETALAEALTAGRIGGAVLDVTEQEPLPPSSPLWSCPNLVLTQHTGGGFGDEVEAKTAFFLKNHARFVRGEPLLNVVDFARPY